MTKSVFIAASERQVNKSAIALGVVELFARQVKSVGFFRPLVPSLTADPIATALIASGIISSRQELEASVGVTHDDWAADPAAALDVIVSKYTALAERCDALVVIGTDFDDLTAGTELDANSEIAANLNTPVIYVCRAANRSPAILQRMAEEALEVFEARDNQIVGIVATRADAAHVDEFKTALSKVRDVEVNVIPHEPLLAAPTVQAQFDAVGAELWRGKADFLTKESLQTIVGAMTLPHVLQRLPRQATVIMPADRLDLLPPLVMAHRSSTYGPLAGIILTGGFDIPEEVVNLLGTAEVDLPIGRTQLDTFSTASRLQRVQGISTSTPRKIEVARALFDHNVDEDALLKAINLTTSDIRTPTMFEHQLMQMARKNVKKIVLPESSDDRILRAADVVLHRRVAEVILLGDPGVISRRAAELGLNLSKAELVDPTDPELVERFAEEYAKLRAHKGVTIEQAREKLTDLSYFGTMMVHLGMADGMVSGAVNTTANTIRPSLEFVKTKPGVSVVSGSFLMAMSSRVVVYADCAVNPNPTAAQLADIAISSAETAVSFGIEPRVAMLSYSTGDSGSGADVDLVREATQIVKEKAPELKVEGPIQFDAAVDSVVAAKKMPGSEVAGKATVFIFPDLNTGNNTYKAVQRTSGAVAVGPVLQGLRKPVNDLSRGALVDDIVSTITITAIQAQTN